MQPIRQINYTIADESNWTIGYTYKGYGYAIKRPDGSLVCNIAEGLRPEEAALASLVSATPELLDALLEIIAVWDQGSQAFPISQARAAVAKAMGNDL